jgi:uncharacterized protein DUF3999
MEKYVASILVFFSSLVNAADDNLMLEDYAKGIELIAEKEASIYQFSLPEQVYRHIANSDMSDIRVFNQAHEPVPHVIRQQKDNGESISETLELPYFPLPFDEIALLDNKIDITVSSEGKVIRIQSADEITGVNNSAKYYLIDASHIEYTIDSIDFKIKGKTSDYAKKIKLESSDDLNNWTPLINNATLTELEYGNYVLKKMRVELPNKRIKYLRFTWLDDANGLFIDSIKANFSKHYVTSKKTWATARLVNKNNEQATYEFNTDGLFNIEQVNIELPQDNTLIDVLIESRFSKDSEWENRYKGVFYKLYINDTEITREPVNLYSVKHRYWRIKLQSTDGIGQAEPLLKYAWRSNDLYFLARGNGPFILAYGNANVNKSMQTSSKLMSIISRQSHAEMVATAIASQEIILKGDLALVAKKELPWQRILLWLVLVMGVFVIAVMVFRLIRQMETNAS